MKMVMDKCWTLAGAVILAVIFIYSLHEGEKISASSENKLVKITLRAAIPNADEVKLAGSFNNWQPRCCLIKNKDSDEWSIELHLLPGVYEYVLLVDGAPWVPGENGQQLKDGLGGKNGVLYVNKHVVKQGANDV